MATNNVINANSTTPLSATNGGTGASNPTANGILVANGASAFSSTTLTNGQLLIGSTGSAPVAASLTAGSNITITPGAGSIEIAASGGGGATNFVIAGNTGDQNGVTGDSTEYDLSWGTTSLSGFTASGSTGFVVPATGKYMIILSLLTNGYTVDPNTTQYRLFGTTLGGFNMTQFNSFPIVNSFSYVQVDSSCVVTLTASETITARFRVSGEASANINVLGDGVGTNYPRLVIYSL